MISDESMHGAPDNVSALCKRRIIALEASGSASDVQQHRLTVARCSGEHVVTSSQPWTRLLCTA